MPLFVFPLILGLSLLLTACPTEQSQTRESASPAEKNTATPYPLNPSPDPVSGSQIFITKGCIACHAVSEISEAKGVIGPKLDQLALTASQRIKGQSAEAYLRDSIEKPAAYLVPGYQNLMTPNLRATMTEPEFEDLIAFLLSLK
jgi:cytochrome c2